MIFTVGAFCMCDKYCKILSFVLKFLVLNSQTSHPQGLVL